ncbi:hypothetical protein [Methylobacterium sp. J-067]|uniref:hypothetical protein n=1 Tax=Methylobacterium sp. J-067 TaxID=2836648 RepID=UPI001FBB2B8F|nr:hypothetical protein [Methylobacterium sp. J-067]MCJ2026449.1 hypothetical protein [Methylobacterium sp. J-067]
MPEEGNGQAATASTGLVGHDCIGTDPDRCPAPKWRGPSVGTIVDPFRGCVHHYESETERAFLTLLISLPGVLRILEQRSVRYDLAGSSHLHTLDVIVDWVGGVREAFAVKHSSEALSRGRTPTATVLAALSVQHGARIAHDFRAVTNDTLDPVAVLNARLVVRCGRDHDHVGMEMARKALAGLGPTTTLRDVAIATGLGMRGFRAAVALIQSGVLANPGGERLDLDVSLENRAAGNNAWKQ